MKIDKNIPYANAIFFVFFFNSLAQLGNATYIFCHRMRLFVSTWIRKMFIQNYVQIK